MAWLDDRIWCHPKIVALPKAARWTYAASVAYSSGFGTGGILDTGAQKIIGSDAKDRRALLETGLWISERDGAIRINDWDSHNGKRDARRLADRERKKAAYWQGKDQESPQENERRNDGETTGETGGEPSENGAESRALKEVTVVTEVTDDGEPEEEALPQAVNESQHPANASGFSRRPAGANERPEEITQIAPTITALLNAIPKGATG